MAAGWGARHANELRAGTRNPLKRVGVSCGWVGEELSTGRPIRPVIPLSSTNEKVAQRRFVLIQPKNIVHYLEHVRS